MSEMVHLLLAVRDRLLNRLEHQQKMRHLYPDCGWIAEERQVMWSQVNLIRSEMRLPLVDLAAVARVENCAVGHTDYSEKFALYCAEIALGMK